MAKKKKKKNMAEYGGCEIDVYVYIHIYAYNHTCI
jgi:hypothetical protein